MKESGNVVLVTGGSAGIGFALAKKFLERKNRVIVTGRNPDKLSRVKERFPALVTEVADMAKESDLTALARKHQDVNILVNNAGVQYNYNIAARADAGDLIKEEIQIDLLGPILLTRFFIPVLKEKPDAAIINVSSGLGLVPKQDAPVYCGCKAGLHIFTKSLRYQLEALNIKVFEILPSLVETAMTSGRGKSKITPEALAEEFWRGFRKDTYEIMIEKVKLLHLINRFSPKVAEKIMR